MGPVGCVLGGPRDMAEKVTVSEDCVVDVTDEPDTEVE
jgi:hypothetical protein